MDSFFTFFFWVPALSIVIVAIILIKFFYKKFFKPALACKKALTHLEAVPNCKPELLECYVKFSGHLASKHSVQSNLSEQTGFFIWSRVMVSWETKQKKPHKGTETHHKILWIESSDELLCLTHSDLTVYIDFNAFIEQGRVELSPQERTEKVCPVICQEKNLDKYQTYHLKEIILHDELITVYGKLIYKPKLGLMIIPTGLLEYPSVIITAKSKHTWNTLKKYYQSEIKDSIAHFITILIIIGSILYWFVS